MAKAGRPKVQINFAKALEAASFGARSGAECLAKQLDALLA
jgi:hypothetical protein